jgi:hypothetical protein
MELLTNYTITTDVMNVYYSCEYKELTIEDSKGQEIEIIRIDPSQMIRCFRNMFCGCQQPELASLDSHDKRYIKELAELFAKYAEQINGEAN